MLTRNSIGVRAMRRLKRYFTRHQRHEQQQDRMLTNLQEMNRYLNSIAQNTQSHDKGYGR